MSELPEVAVAIVTHNGAQHLDEQLESIAAQTIRPDRIYWVDDRSEDETRELMREFAARANISIVEVESPEPAPDLYTRIARNFEAALEAASGASTVMLCDQDDVWEPHRIERQHARITAGASMTSGDAVLIDADGTESGGTLRARFPVPAAWPDMTTRERLESVMRQSVATGAASAISTDLLAHALPIPPGWLHDRWLSLVAAARGGLDIDETSVVRYRVYDDQVVGLSGETDLWGLRRIRSSWAKPVTNVRKVADLAIRLRELAIPDVKPALSRRAVVLTYLTPQREAEPLAPPEPFIGKRVVQVTAHYPPNFVSGGTLVPQRIAAAVAAAGHESFVYAGSINDWREPLTTWTESEGDVTVRWITTTPFVGWTEGSNYDNPLVVRDFVEWLDTIRPDIVHVHSLQGMGAGVVDAAKRSGARVVVTMHDFWWVCSRQFLVDTELRPCQLVVDCGDCACAVDRPWLDSRNAYLRAQLNAADMIVAPSASAAKVLAANGIPADVLEVDENGVPSVEPAAHPVGDPLRLLYLGGANPLKGSNVLIDAIRALPDDGSWTLNMFGADRALVPGAGPIVVRPAFAPTVLPDVLVGHDVLIAPSIMRESHSVAVREALAAGLAVICTDSLGPEEAVIDGINGLIVSAGSVDELSTALRRIVGEPGLASALMNRGSASEIRTVDDHTAGTIDRYERLYTSTPPIRVGPRVRSVLFIVGIDGAPARYRAHLPAEALSGKGIDAAVVHYRDPEVPLLASHADAVVVYRVPATTQIIDLLTTLKKERSDVPILFDVDDLIFDPSIASEVHGLAGLTDDERALWWRGVRRYRTTMELADVFIGATKMLCLHAATVTGLPVRRFGNGVGALLGRMSEAALRHPRRTGPVRIGYFSGTSTHDADWAAIEPAVLEVMRARPDVELWMAGHVTPTPALKAVRWRVRFIPFQAWQRLPRLLRDVDVCVAPLATDPRAGTSSRFNEAKSAIKWLEAALVETAVVASATEPFGEVIESGRNGFLARDHEEWVAALTQLVDDESLRTRIGRRARRDALLQWSPALQADRYIAIVEDAIEQVVSNGHRPATDWEPVFEDEPFDAMFSTENRYTWRPEGSVRARARHGYQVARHKFAAARRLYRGAGARAVIVRVGQIGVRRLRKGRGTSR